MLKSKIKAVEKSTTMSEPSESTKPSEQDQNMRREDRVKAQENISMALLDRAAKREVKGLEYAAKKHLGDQQGFDKWADTFYVKHLEIVEEAVSYIAALYGVAEPAVKWDNKVSACKAFAQGGLDSLTAQIEGDVWASGVLKQIEEQADG
jgi:hypothetical protein